MNFNQYKDDLKSGSGTLIFKYISKDIFDKNKPYGIIFETIAGEIFYKLDRDENFNLKFYRSSPSTGTRLATVNITEISYSENIKIYLSWSPEHINVYAGSLTGAKKLLEGKEQKTHKKFRIANDGSIVELGDDNVIVSGYEIYDNNGKLLELTAIESWEDKLEAINILMEAESKNNKFKFENIISNVIIVTLVNGFESYCKKRFLEIENEGRNPNTKQLIQNFTTKSEKNNDIELKIIAESKEKNISILEVITKSNRINFQNFKKCNKAFNKAYNVSFYNDLNLNSEKLELIKKAIKYRHKLVHHSMTESIFNINNKKQIFTNMEVGKKCIQSFTDFIYNLHKETS